MSGVKHATEQSSFKVENITCSSLWHKCHVSYYSEVAVPTCCQNIRVKNGMLSVTLYQVSHRTESVVFFRIHFFPVCSARLLLLKRRALLYSWGINLERFVPVNVNSEVVTTWSIAGVTRWSDVHKCISLKLRSRVVGSTAVLFITVTSIRWSAETNQPNQIFEFSSFATPEATYRLTLGYHGGSLPI